MGALSVFMVSESIACLWTRYIVVFHLERRAALEKYRPGQWRFAAGFCAICIFGGMTDYLIGIGLLLGAYALYHRHPIWLLNRGWSWIGRLSYSMYLTHMLVLGLIVQVKLPFAPLVSLTLMFIMTLLFTIGLSWFTYSWIEQPGIRWGKKLISRMKPVHKQEIRSKKVLPKLQLETASDNIWLKCLNKSMK